MSYILDALNRSEKERSRNQAPRLQREDDNQPSGGLRTRQLLGLFIAILVVNLAVIYFLFADRLGSPATQQDSPMPAVTDTVSRVEEPVRDIPESNAGNPAPANKPVTAAAETVTAGPPSRLLPVVPVDALPGVIRAQLPDLEVSTHIYARDPDLRLARINDIQRHEGEQLSRDLWLVEITETGIVLAFGEHQFVIDVVEDWQLEETN